MNIDFFLLITCKFLSEAYSVASVFVRSPYNSVANYNAKKPKKTFKTMSLGFIQAAYTREAFSGRSWQFPSIVLPVWSIAVPSVKGCWIYSISSTCRGWTHVTSGSHKEYLEAGCLALLECRITLSCFFFFFPPVNNAGQFTETEE
jgi:hypothetical protein